MAPKLKLTRDVTPDECEWLDRTFKAGETVFEYHGATYGCCGAGVACCEVDGENPFFEMPQDALAPAD